MLWWILPLLLVALGFGLLQAFPFGLMYDDGYFYAQIAYNLAAIGESSFDGLTVTSGYHLAWGFVLAAVSWLVGLFSADRQLHLFAFQVAFAGLATAAACLVSRRPRERIGALVLVLLGTLLMDTLLLSFVLIALSRMIRDGRPKGRDRVLADALVFLVPWVRVDAAVIVAVHCVALAVMGSWREGLRRSGILGLGLVTQIGGMLILFDEPFSVSAILKVSAGSVFGATLESLLGVGGIVLGNVLRSTVFLGLLLSAAIVVWVRRSNVAVVRSASLTLGAVAFSLGHLVTHPIPFWCYLPAWLLLFDSIVSAGVLETQDSEDSAGAPPGTGASVARLAQVVAIALVVVGAVFLVHKIKLHVEGLEVSRGSRRFAEEVGRRVPARQPIYQVDGSGFVAWYSGRHLINGDGLVNTHDYARRLQSGGLEHYLEEHEICFLIDNRRPYNDRIVDHAGLRVDLDEATEIFRSPAYGLFSTTDFVLYQLTAKRCQDALRG